MQFFLASVRLSSNSFDTEMPSKEICHLVLSSSSMTIVIDNVSFDLSKLSTLELSKYKKKLVDSALKQI